MELAVPLYLVVVLGAGIGAFAAGRQDAISGPRAPLVWLALLVAGALCLLSRVGLGPAEWLSSQTFHRGLGGACLALSAAAGYRATRQRARADLFHGSVVGTIDEAVERVRAGTPRLSGVFSGRLDVSEAVTSPGGIVCAFYDAEVREAAPDGRRGRLVSEERGHPRVLFVAGDRARVAAEVSPAAMLARTEVRRVRILETAAVSGDERLADGDPPVEALSFERLGRIGERVWVAGELRPGPAKGSYVVGGAGGTPAVVGVGVDPQTVGRQAARRAWALFGSAGALSVVAALLIA